MEIQTTLDFLLEYRRNTRNSKNKKYAEQFIRLLNELNLKEIDELKRRRLNSELNLILQNFEIEGENINVKRELKKFIKILRTEFSMTLPWYYTHIGALIGLLPTMFLGIPYILLGLSIGGSIGYLFDEKAKKEGKKLKTELNEFISWKKN